MCSQVLTLIRQQHKIIFSERYFLYTYVDPTQFWILTTISFCMVFVAAVTFSVSYCSVHKSNIDRSDYEQILDKEMVDVLGDV